MLAEIAVDRQLIADMEMIAFPAGSMHEDVKRVCPYPPVGGGSFRHNRCLICRLFGRITPTDGGLSHHVRLGDKLIKRDKEKCNESLLSRKRYERDDQTV